ncbi:hypothetical protein TREPR_2097 [Treponema primitia ZAS-2]|uniref:Uncharacterized protein n=1 Tax=Treponema primitia (strain ATCC BAA-887 / DSM 12427 / ZAS-2) TaxID=545694 RepID=F5YJP4_TREPZ|nr:hypothetical protein [Treponema primitia]AEF84732.1 hypothetical protein TREPR_2097 [Treponema primitia ZAS-2]
MAQFLQSQKDFPLMVHLGRKAPSWELNRWGRDALRFSPAVGGSYSLRGDKRTLHYSGDRESHRFTILDGSHFEYDIILNREPEGNRVYLAIEGWEQFDFFRQPDTYGPEILRGSYAVYKKEMVINSPAYHVGTGKICHIHRPKIIDARGRDVWGDVWIDKGLMAITIPEGWLGEAAYPVVVDPMVGSNTVGAYSQFEYLPEWLYWDYLQDLANDPATDMYDYYYDEKTFYDDDIILNRYTTPAAISGTYNTYVYVNKTDNWMRNGQYGIECCASPLLYSEYTNKPKNLLCTNFTIADIRVDSGKPAKWNKATFTVNSIPSGTDVWFGFSCRSIGLQFDYGVPLFRVFNNSIPKDWNYGNKTLTQYLSEYHLLDLSGTIDVFADDDGKNMLPGSRYDMKFSMYLELPPQAYTRTLTQGVKLGDSRKLAAAYKKTLAMNGRNTAALGHGSSYVRKQNETVRGMDLISRIAGICRNLAQQINVGELIGASRGLLRKATDTIKTVTEENRFVGNERSITETGNAADGDINTKRGLFRNMPMTVKGNDDLGRAALLLRVLSGKAAVSDAAGHWGDYVRGLYVAAGSCAGTARQGEYHREAFDTAEVSGMPLRSLGVFIRLVTVGFVRDFLLRRFLKSNEELVLKSAVCRELVLESKIH